MLKKLFPQEFFQLEAASGIVLFISALIALVWANSSFHESYRIFWNFQTIGMSLHHLINDGLMTIFFLVVGLEIKREIIRGELSSKTKAILPIAAAIGGMLVPALIYTAFNQGVSGKVGWGIPIATDIAFAIGVLTLLGNRVPASLKVFLTALAIVDDLGAVLIIAFFYTAQLSRISLVIGIGILGILFILNKMGVLKTWVYLAAGALAWLAFLKSGIHATIAGVLLSFVIPTRTGAKLEHVLRPWVSFGIMPLFALANAGVLLSGGTMLHPVSVGIMAGLLVGKQVGITFFSWIAVKSKIAALPEGVGWGQLYGIGWLGGIGFTMSLFIANLAFNDAHLIAVAKLGILTASVLAGVVGAAILFFCNRLRRTAFLAKIK